MLDERVLSLTVIELYGHARLIFEVRDVGEFIVAHVFPWWLMRCAIIAKLRAST
jgi:hypothetical protein